MSRPRFRRIEGSRRLTTARLVVAGVVAAGLATPAAATAAAGSGSGSSARDYGHCSRADRLAVPGAERQEVACLSDLATPTLISTGHTDASDWLVLQAAGTRNPTGFPGIQVDGYFPDTSTTNAYHGWNHDSQFVLRLPDRWNGGLVVTGAPGVRRQYSLDSLISDYVLAKGYAFVSTDKGNSGNAFYTDGATPGDAIAEWHQRVTQLTVAAKRAVAQRYGSAPRRTLVTGISNGGYLTRWQLENRPDLYDGGVDWEGTLVRPNGPNVLTYLPTVLANYPSYAATGDPAAHQAILDAGMPAGSEFLWDYHYGVYWDLTQRVYREEYDPSYDGAQQAGYPFCQPGSVPGCDADYRYFTRPPAVRDAVAKGQLTGRIGKPMLTLHGTLDALLPISTDSDVYTRLVRGAGKGSLHRYYVIEDGTHVDSLYNDYPDKLRPILPCYRSAFDAMERWLAGTSAPPPSHLVPRPASGDVVNTCSLR